MPTEEQKNGKSLGPDGIPAEIVKEDIITSTQMLYEIYEKLKFGKTNPYVHEDWKEGHLAKNPKKDDLADC